MVVIVLLQEEKQIWCKILSIITLALQNFENEDHLWDEQATGGINDTGTHKIDGTVTSDVLLVA